MVLQTVKVLVTLTTDFAAVRLLLLHAEGTRIRGRRFRVNNREGTVGVVMQLLIVVAVLGDS